MFVAEAQGTGPDRQRRKPWGSRQGMDLPGHDSHPLVVPAYAEDDEALPGDTDFGTAAQRARPAFSIRISSGFPSFSMTSGPIARISSTSASFFAASFTRFLGCNTSSRKVIFN